MEQWERSSVESRGSREEGLLPLLLFSLARSLLSAPPPPLPPPSPLERNSPVSAPGPDRSFPDSLSVSSVRGRHPDPPPAPDSSDPPSAPAPASSTAPTSITRLPLASRVASRGAARARPASDVRQLRSTNLEKKRFVFADRLYVMYLIA